MALVLIASSGSSSLSLLSELLGFITAGAVITGGVIAYFLRRRGSSGQVKTSDAATLWAQSQEMRIQLIAEKTRAEDQRDRVMAIQSEQVMPALTATAEALQQVLLALAQIQKTLDALASTSSTAGRTVDAK